jgi:xanthine dehydrogenase YagS FAD-binding subunit
MDYARPETLVEAFELLAQTSARPLAGGTDLAGQIDRGLSAPALVVDLQALPLRDLVEVADGVAIGAMVTLRELAADPLMEPFAAITAAASQAASPLLRARGTVVGNILQWTRCTYFRGVEWTCWLGGGETCYAQIGVHHKHNLQPGDCISAHPSDLAPALAASGARARVESASGAREVDLLSLYRRPTPDNRSLHTLEAGELVTQILLPAPPDASTYQRVGEREAFSFPLVSVAGARRESSLRLVASGVANIPLELDPDDPVRELPGNPQSAWKRTLVTTLAARAIAQLR